MSDVKQDVSQALHNFVKTRKTVVIQPATVIAVNETEGTCDVTDLEGIELYDIRIRAAQDGDENGFTLVPAVDSTILIGNIGDSPNAWVVLETTELVKVVALVDSAKVTVAGGTVAIEKGTSKLEVSSGGTLIERNSQSLKSTIDALIDQIKLITVTCAAPGTPSTPPLNMALFDAIKTQIDEILQ